jgi:hypothetical protein
MKAVYYKTKNTLLVLLDDKPIYGYTGMIAKKVLARIKKENKMEVKIV